MILWNEIKKRSFFFCVKFKKIKIEVFFTLLCVKRCTRIVKILEKNNTHQRSDEQKFWKLSRFLRYSAFLVS